MSVSRAVIHTKDLPVIKRASGLHRYDTSPATSDGSPIGASGTPNAYMDQGE